MGDPQTLSNFVTWAKDNYPADHYALILSDHGHGLGGGMVDDNSFGLCWNGSELVDCLSIKDMDTALKTITSNGIGKIDILYMDACLMGMLEDAYQFLNYVDYYVASENLKQPYFTPHGESISSVTATTTPIELATKFASTYTANGHEDTHNFLFTMAVMNMSQINPVLNATKLLAQQLDGLMRTNYPNIASILQVVQTFDYNSNGIITPEEGSIDLYDFASLVKNIYSDPDTQASAQAVMDAIGNFVIFEDHQEDDQRKDVIIVTVWLYISRPDQAVSIHLSIMILLRARSGQYWGARDYPVPFPIYKAMIQYHGEICS